MSFAPSQTLSSRTQDTLLGAFVLVAFVMIGWLMFEDLRTQSSDQLSYRTTLTSSYGLSVGSPVRLNGVNVGRINNIKLNAQGVVALELLMQSEYADLYGQGSYLKIDSTLAIDSVLSGASIVFVSGKGAPLDNDSLLVTEEPKSLDALLEEWDVQALSKKVGDILQNLDAIVSNVSNNQDSLTQSLNNVASLTSTMNEASKQLPDVLSQMQQTMTVMQSTLQDTSVVINQNVGAFADVATQSAALIESIDTIAQDIQPTVNALPETQALLNDLLVEVNGLTQQLRQHWLLQNGDALESDKKPKSNNGLFPPDDSLYDEAPKVSSKGEPES